MRAAAYLRVSTDEQASNGVSLEAQRTMIVAYAGLYGLELVAVVEDAGVSAKTLERPGLQRVLAMLRRGDVQAVAVAKLDRLTRSVRDLGQLLDDHFGAHGKAALVSVSEQIDGRSTGGRMVLNLLATVSQWEREVIGAEFVCSAPHMGPIRRVPSDKKILLCNGVGEPSIKPFRDRIPDLLTGAVYTVGSHMGARKGASEIPFDHSNAGIASHASAGYQSFKSRRAAQNNARCIWFDVEADIGSINVPASVGYTRDLSIERYTRPGYANTYDPDVKDKAWRDEAVRFFRLLCQGFINEAAEDGFANFEIGSFNHPSETSYSSVDNEGRYTLQANELNAPLLCPYMAFGGGNCYLSTGNTANMEGLTIQQLVDRSVAKCKRQTEEYRSRILPPQKLIPAIFNVWVGPPPPDNDMIVPAGAMRDLVTAILDAGADGLFIYQFSSSMNEVPRALERYDEVVDVIIARGDFVNPYA